MVYGYCESHTKVWAANAAQSILTTWTMDEASCFNYCFICLKESIPLEKLLLTVYFWWFALICTFYAYLQYSRSLLWRHVFPFRMFTVEVVYIFYCCIIIAPHFIVTCVNKLKNYIKKLISISLKLLISAFLNLWIYNNFSVTKWLHLQKKKTQWP